MTTSPLPRTGLARRRLTGVAVLLAALLAGCGSVPSGSPSSAPHAPTGSGSSGPNQPPSTPAAPAAVTLTANVKDAADDVGVDKLVKATASAGTLTKVSLTFRGVDTRGQKTSGKVSGAYAKERTSWTAKSRLEPSATYKLVVTGKNTSGATATLRSTFKTRSLSLSQQAFPTMFPLKKMKVGVGMPITINFDLPIRDKAEIERHLRVVSSPKQSGSWRWFSDREIRYRPAKYWKPGTKVTAYADLNGVKAGGGIYGQKSVKTSFTVGRSMQIKINLATKVAKVYRSGKMVRRIYVSGGKPGWQTRSGIKLIMAKEWNKVMTNEMIGAKEDYRLTSAYALRITNSGEFLHSAPWNAGYFGRVNASHGCTGMSNADSGWLINNTLIGDPVITTGTGRGMELGNGYGDWNISYKQYKKGSAL